MIVSQAKAIDILKNGGVVALPTETVYGLAGMISNESAIRKIYSTKQRPASNPLIIHIGKPSEVYKYAQNIPIHVENLINHFWPGPLTVILKKSDLVSNLITAGQETVALRMPDNARFLNIINQLNTPLAAPSANPYQKISPTYHEHVEKLFNKQVPVVADGRCQFGIESTIIDVTSESEVTILRPGTISAKDIEMVLGLRCSISEKMNIKVPGNCSRHYSPNKSTLIYSPQMVEEGIKSNLLNKPTALTFNKTGVTGCNTIKMPNNAVLYAKKLYDVLMQADNSHYGCIIIEMPPMTNSWLSVIDKLQRAGQFIA